MLELCKLTKGKQQIETYLFLKILYSSRQVQWKSLTFCTRTAPIPCASLSVKTVVLAAWG